MTVAEIRNSIAEEFVANSVIKSLYGLDPGRSFDDQFSKVSLENIIFSVVSPAIWMCYQLFSQHKTEVREILAQNKTHTPGWYATRAKEFRFGFNLIAETDQYDDAGLTPDQISTAQVVTHSAAVETSDQSILFLKTAAEMNGVKQPLPEEQHIAFVAYMLRIKDAGVRISFINAPADDLKLELDIYYNPLVLSDNGSRLDGTDDAPVQNAVRDYLNGLDFNSLYTNQALVDRLQLVDGIEIAELRSAASRNSTQVSFTEINAKSVPYAGYYQIADENLQVNFIPNE